MTVAQAVDRPPAWTTRADRGGIAVLAHQEFADVYRSVGIDVPDLVGLHRDAALAGRIALTADRRTLRVNPQHLAERSPRDVLLDALWISNQTAAKVSGSVPIHCAEQFIAAAPQLQLRQPLTMVATGFAWPFGPHTETAALDDWLVGRIQQRRRIGRAWSALRTAYLSRSPWDEPKLPARIGLVDGKRSPSLRGITQWSDEEGSTTPTISLSDRLPAALIQPILVHELAHAVHGLGDESDHHDESFSGTCESVRQTLVRCGYPDLPLVPSFYDASVWPVPGEQGNRRIPTGRW